MPMNVDAELEIFRTLRERMVREQLRARGIADARVLEAMGRVPRHNFVAAEFRAEAYEDHPIPIAEGQTISQPYIVALMLQYLSVQPSDAVLEVGAGSGYVAALLAELAAKVFAMERHAELASKAKEALVKTGYGRVTVVLGDGSMGLPSEAPFDRILVSAAAASVPAALFEQLAENGRMIIPAGTPDVQQLQLVRKQEGKQVVSSLAACRFVPLVTGS